MTIKFEDLTLTQEAYVSTGCGVGDTYEARAEDKDGNSFLVVWDVLDGWRESFAAGDLDEGDACNWDKPSKIIPL